MSQATSADTKALAMTLTPSQSVFKAGSLPSFQVTIANQSQEAVMFCRYRLDYRLKAAMVVKGEQNYEAQPFVPQTWQDIRKKDIVTLAPGESLTHSLSFDNDPVFGFVRRAKQPPIIPRSNSLTGFPAGSYSFNTALSNQVGLYVGKDGVFDHRLEGRKVPDQWPGIQGCFIKLIEGTATVTFTED
jgi:hypothetical protein